MGGQLGYYLVVKSVHVRSERCGGGGLPREGSKGERCRVQVRRSCGDNGRRQYAFLVSYGWDY